MEHLIKAFAYVKPIRALPDLVLRPELDMSKTEREGMGFHLVFPNDIKVGPVPPEGLVY